MLAIMSPEVDANNVNFNEIKVFKSNSDEPTDLLKMIEEKDWLCRFEENKNNGLDLSFT